MDAAAEYSIAMNVMMKKENKCYGLFSVLTEEKRREDNKTKKVMEAEEEERMKVLF